MGRLLDYRDGFKEWFKRDASEDAKRRERKMSDSGDVPMPPEGEEGLPIPASQDPLRRLY